MSLAQVIDHSRRQKESWRYTDIEKILKAPFAAKKSAKIPPRENAVGVQLIFVDGVLDQKQSNFGDLPRDILTGAAGNYKLKLAGQTCLVTQPVELLFQGTKEAQVKLAITLGENGRLTLIERHEATAPQVIQIPVHLHKQAKLIHGKIIYGGEHAHIAETSAHIEAGAYYDRFDLIKGGRLIRNEIEAKLDGKLAQCNLNGAMLVRGQEHADTTIRVTHAAPFGTSRQVYKSVIADKARAVFQGKILVAEGAQKTDGHQLSRALLLSDQAEMDAKPELEIYADDVKCSHGSTVGDLDDDAMFYLRARGLDEVSARALLIEAFVGEIIDEIHVPEWREACRKEVEEWLHDK
ncbi:MAG TPA: Fe-S cluster assembly protein SufD [Alphaproteobacteria bacterium]|nr:Fe-S cluster assembly protein SufD [Alphaproteobacteria bacterium]